ncbi:hypothetical protein XENOCAPTIV_017191 [Xenoophorus captivus]|uniref:Uncharacterized protein n=1 Tax=Xenoophorus captivus TaxID=1517983 RepID=A0ABV0S7F4_9TELE
MAAGTRITKGLVLIFTLLSLVCFMSSLSDKDKLTKVKERHQQTMEDLEKLKNKKKSITDTSLYLMSHYENIIDPMIAMVKQCAGELPDDLLQLDAALKKTKDLMEKTKTFIKKANDDLDVQIKQNEELNKQNEKKINCLENHRV